MRSALAVHALALGIVLAAAPARAQQTGAPAEIVITPPKVEMKLGRRETVKATVRDAAGNVVQANVIFFSRDRQSIAISPQGEIRAMSPGEYLLAAMIPADPGDTSRRAEPLLQVDIPVTVVEPAVASLEIDGERERYYAKTSVPLRVRAIDELGQHKKSAAIEYVSSDPAVASVDGFGELTLAAVGHARITVRAEGVEKALEIGVAGNPLARIELRASAETAKTGDVVRFAADPLDGEGRTIPDMPIRYATYGQPAAEIIAVGSIGHIEPDGRFVAERSGLHTIVATAGDRSAMTSIRVASRKVHRDVEVVGRGPVRDRHTSDLWVWEGPDGRDYAITGTWSAEGHAYFWDVTDPGNIAMIDTVKVDARTVNDVKVSEDGRIAVISREGASNRRNGIVILDISDPGKGVRKIAEYDDELTGGVHNVFISKRHVYALSAGTRYDIINIENPYEPFRVGKFELTTPGHSIHDVWVADGIAYSSNWSDGVVVVDVGGGGMGGSPADPVKMAQYVYPSGANHAAFPFRSRSTGKFYVAAGDEAFPYPDAGPGMPEKAAGWIHIIEWDDWDRPSEVARYAVPEVGTHNLWIEDDVMYVAYYNGGLRVVDVSGELLGDLYRQGREIARFFPEDPQGHVKNAPMVWGPQPFKGHIFISDHYSGLWALKLTGEPREAPGLLEDR